MKTIIKFFSASVCLTLTYAVITGCTTWKPSVQINEPIEMRDIATTNLFVLVLSLSGPQQSLSMWTVTSEERSTLMADKTCSADSAWNYFRGHAGLSLELLPQLREIEVLAEAYQKKHPEWVSGSPPLSETDRIWSYIRFDISGMPESPSRDVWLFDRYLRSLSDFYGRNICVDSPFPPRFWPSPVRNEQPCVLFIRDMPKDKIEEAHRLFLREWFANVNISEVPNDTKQMWEAFFAFFRKAGSDLTVVDVSLKRNIVILKGSKDSAEKFEHLCQWL